MDLLNNESPADAYARKLRGADIVFLYPETNSTTYYKDLCSKIIESLNLNVNIVVVEQSTGKGGGEFIPITLENLFYATFVIYFAKNLAIKIAEELVNGPVKLIKNLIENKTSINESVELRLQTESEWQITYRFPTNISNADSLVAERLIGPHFLQINNQNLFADKMFIYLPEFEKWVEV